MKRKVTGAFAALALAVGILVVPTAAAHADDYPTWEDVERARADEAAQAALVDEIKAHLVFLESEVQRTQEDLQAKGLAHMQAEARYNAKKDEVAALKAQAEDAAARAAESELRAQQWAATVVRIGGADPTLELFSESESAPDILSAIGISTRISSQANALYEQASQQRNTAQSLTDQAAVMEQELGRLEQEAQLALEAAQAASEAASRALLEQQEHKAQMEQQLLVLAENRAATEADYQVGEQKRLEEKMKEINWPEVSNSGWVRPAGGWISSYYGWRPDTNSFHEGLDFAAGCWSNIRAASSGTVSFTGWSGGYGYLTVIDHGGGLATYYAHQPDGGIAVYPGQWVEVGDLIGYVGNTGNSYGCHLHFEVRGSGVATDPLAFLAANGVYV